LTMAAYVGHTAAHPQTHQIRIAYAAPDNPAHQPLYELLQERHALEALQRVFSPLLLPAALEITIRRCDGQVNAFYWQQRITICYEYIDEIRQTVPRNLTIEGIGPVDAIVGQFFYVAAHEMGHAVFDLLRVPVLGREEDAADQFAAYMMLQFDRQEAR